MRRFHGDLLMGGAAIREIDAVIEDDDASDHHEGQFEVGADKLSLLELGRPYLFLIDDGDAFKLVVKEMDETSDHRRLVVQFESMS